MSINSSLSCLIFRLPQYKFFKVLQLSELIAHLAQYFKSLGRCANSPLGNHCIHLLRLCYDIKVHYKSNCGNGRRHRQIMRTTIIQHHLPVKQYELRYLKSVYEERLLCPVMEKKMPSLSLENLGRSVHWIFIGSFLQMSYFISDFPVFISRPWLWQAGQSHSKPLLTSYYEVSLFKIATGALVFQIMD